MGAGDAEDTDQKSVPDFFAGRNRVSSFRMEAND